MPDNPAQPPPPIQPPPIVPPAPPPGSLESQARTWNMLCHLSALAGFIIPFGNILGPLLVWQLKKNEFPSVEIHGKAALNFQITVTIAAIVGFLLAGVFAFFCIGFLLIPVVIAVGLCGMIFSIIAGVKANNGETYRYPVSLELVK